MGFNYWKDGKYYVGQQVMTDTIHGWKTAWIVEIDEYGFLLKIDGGPVNVIHGRQSYQIRPL